MQRSLKAQIERDARGVFLDLEGFAEIETIRYWRNGGGKPPDELHIPVVTNNDGNMNSVWNKNKAQQRAGHEPTIFQVDRVIWVASADFQPKPKKRRRISVGSEEYDILSVSDEDGMLKIELRRLEE